MYGQIDSPCISGRRCDTRGMAFVIQREGINQALAFTDDDKYDFEPDGVLKLTQGDRTTYYSPGAWDWVSTTNDHKPGPLVPRKPAGPVGG